MRRMPQEDKTMQSIIRKDEEAVSPVIATILMVAITVVLAAVLYVMVSGLITGPGSTPTAMGVSTQPSSDGTNGCSLAKVSSTATAIQAGDRIWCKTTWYVSGTTYQYSDGTNILATGKLR